jgi:hypothetical protein
LSSNCASTDSGTNSSVETSATASDFTVLRIEQKCSMIEI